ncbi:MAG TPA: N-acetylmuramoyl-L-alanine amidase [Xanthobacteraceae bacterium]|nr:N-acetylmuramoyl-L-alanine amidase [Xanthobacteraceae bacterium]
MRRIGTIAFLILAALAAQGAPHRAAGEEAGATAKPAEATCDRAAFRLVIDVGHTPQVPGAKSARGLKEFDFNLRLAKLVEQQLVEAGFAKTVLLVTEGPALLSLARRVARADALHPDLLLSIHHDSVPDSFLEKWEYNGEKHSFSDRFKGHSLFVSYGNRDRKGSLLFARLLGLALKSRGLAYTPHYTEKFMGRRRRELIDPEAGVYRYDQLVVLMYPHMPAVLLEAGSIINRDEELAMGTPERQAAISAAVLEAVEGFCKERRPVPPERMAHPNAPAKARLRPAAARAPASAAKPQ